MVEVSRDGLQVIGKGGRHGGPEEGQQNFGAYNRNAVHLLRRGNPAVLTGDDRDIVPSPLELKGDVHHMSLYPTDVGMEVGTDLCNLHASISCSQGPRYPSPGPLVLWKIPLQ